MRWSQQNLSAAELERKWRLQLEQEAEAQWLAEAAFNAAQNAAQVPGAGGGTLGSMTPPVNPLGSGTIVFNGENPLTTGSFVAATAEDINGWLPQAADGFTIEWFQKYDSAHSSGTGRVWSLGKDTQAEIGVSQEGLLYVWPVGVSADWDLAGGNPDGRWAHVALVYEAAATELAIYLDGVRCGHSTTATFNLDNTTKQYSLYIGSDGLSASNGWAGSITNFRWVNGLLQSPSELQYPVPTAPLSETAETRLLLLGGSQTDPVKDATDINHLTYSNVTWSSSSPF